MIQYKNGNAEISISSDGTRIIEFNGELRLDWPLNVDIRVTNKCAFGFNPNTRSAICSFCHESARTDGSECDYLKLQEILSELPAGVELAIGGNAMTGQLVDFLKWAKLRGYICNITVNQGHLVRDLKLIKQGIEDGWIAGLGVSYRSMLKWNVPELITNYQNTVFHVIAGIDDIDDIMKLATRGVKKILVLGEKDFGFNLGNVDLNSITHKKWLWKLPMLFDAFDVVSFDNLGIEQTKPNRFMDQQSWDEFYQGEHSIYINAVDQYFAPSSRSDQKIYFNITTLKQYFINNEQTGY